MSANPGPVHSKPNKAMQSSSASPTTFYSCAPNWRSKSRKVDPTPQPSHPRAVGIIRTAGNFINTALARATQRTQRFNRWVRVWICIQDPWRDSVAPLKEVWGGIVLRDRPLIKSVSQHVSDSHLKPSSKGAGPATQSSASTFEISNWRASVPSTRRISKVARMTLSPFEHIEAIAAVCGDPILQ